MTKANNQDRNGRATPAKRRYPAHWDDLLTERSVRFHNGTYSWNGSEGFWDDSGIYHEFNDPNDPEAYPPTPRPVGLWLEDGEAQDADDGVGSLLPLEIDDGSFLRKHVSVDENKPVHKYKLCGTENPSAVLSETGDDARAAMVGARANLFTKGGLDEENGKPTTKLLRHYDALMDESHIPHKSGQAADAKVADIVEASPSDASSLSDCPSDLSDWDVEDSVNYLHRANHPVSGLKPESSAQSNQTLQEGSTRHTKAKPKARGSSIDSGIDLRIKRRSIRNFLNSK